MIIARRKAASQEAIVLFSGGIDSMACAHFMRAQGYAVQGIFVDYSQAALQSELRAVGKIARSLSMPVTELRVHGFHSSGAGELAGRNCLLFSMALFAS